MVWKLVEMLDGGSLIGGLRILFLGLCQEGMIAVMLCSGRRVIWLTRVLR